MERMYKIKRCVPENHPIFPGGLNGEETCRGLKNAQIAMRETVTEKFGDPNKYLPKIDEYCQKYYPDNPPPEFEKLKNLITDVITNPAFPESQKKLEQKYDWFYFEDDRINFEFYSALLYETETGFETVPLLIIEIYDDDKELFVEGVISCFIIKDFPEDDIMYRCWLSAGVYRGLDIQMTLASEDEE